MAERQEASVASVDPAVPPARRRRADARRNLDAIVVAAQRLLQDDPQASMGEIAAAAHVHRATVHRHFAARDDLVTAVRARAMDDTLAAMHAALDDGPAGAAARLEAITAAMLTVGDAYRLYRFTTWRDEYAVDRSREIEAAVVPLLAAGQREGDVRADVEPARLLVAYGGLVVAALPAIAEGAMTVAGAAAFIRTMLAPQRT